MRNEPTISIITPVYNCSKYIELCIKNVIDQDYAGAEHIIADGESTDGSVEIIRGYAEKYSHIRWVSEQDKGQSDAMNKGISMAKGEILGFLNADDYYEPGALNRMGELFKSCRKPTLLVGNCNVWKDNGDLWFVSRPYNISLFGLLFGKILDAFPMNPSAYFYHASLHKKIGLYNVDEHYGMDLEFLLNATRKAHIRYVDETFGNYRYLEGTKTFEDDKSGKNELRVKRIREAHRRKLTLLGRIKLKWQRTVARDSLRQ